MAHTSNFEQLLIHSKTPIAGSTLLILAWIAISDDSLAQNELNHLFKIAQRSNFTGDIKLITELAANQDPNALAVALEFLREDLEHDNARKALFMEIIIRMALADGILCPEEINIIHLLADSLSYSSLTLNKLFKEITGKSIPESPDLSASYTWQKFDQHNSRSKKEARYTKSIIGALRILGLQQGATLREIKKRFRKLAHETHPDKFQHLDETARVAADENFRIIRSSYEYLVEAYEKSI